MEENVSISIVVPFFNRENWLPRTLKSLANSTYRPLELVFVDNLSTDNSMRLVQTFKKQYENADFSIDIITCEKRGASAARNAGLQRVKSPIVCFFDSDDEFDDAMLYDAKPFFDNYDIIACTTNLRFPSQRIKSRRSCYTSSAADQILTSMLATQGMLFHTDFIRQHNGWNEQLPIWNDWELGVRLLKQGCRIKWLLKPYHVINIHSDSITGSNRKANFEGYKMALSAVANMALTQKEHFALNARCAILSAEVAKERANNESRLLLKNIDINKWFMRMLYYYARTLHKGSWMLARLYMKLRYGKE